MTEKDKEKPQIPQMGTDLEDRRQEETAEDKEKTTEHTNHIDRINHRITIDYIVFK